MYSFPLLSSIQVFIKSELKVGVVYVKENQYTEEEILANNEHSPLFDEFLTIIGEKVRLKGAHAKTKQKKDRIIVLEMT